MSLSDDVRATRAALNTEIDGLLAVPLPEERDAADAANATIAEKLASRDTLDARLAQLDTESVRRAASDAAVVKLGVAEPRATTEGKDTVYTKGGTNSYFLDLARSSQPGSEESFEAVQRLTQHAQMMSNVPDSAVPEMFRSGASKRAAGSPLSGVESRVTPSRVGGQGGYFVPPIWLIDDFVPYLRPGRTVADLYQGMDLPAGTDSVNIPKLTLGTLVGTQADNGAVTDQDITDTYVTAPVRTLAGQSDIAIQLLEQSPVGAGFDQVILKDLAASYNQQIDIASIVGTGSNSQMKGLANIAGINNVTFTSGSPTVALLYPVLMQAVSQIARQRFLPPTAIVMTPQRWFWIAAGLDTANRPLILPKDASAFNPMGAFDPTGVEGLVGSVAGIPIFIDANIPSNVGAGANQDTIYVAKFDDLFLFEGAMRTRVLQEVLSGTLSIRIQLYNYTAALVDRFPVSVTAINGTGLVTPAGF